MSQKKEEKIIDTSIKLDEIPDEDKDPEEFLPPNEDEGTNSSPKSSEVSRETREEQKVTDTEKVKEDSSDTSDDSANNTDEEEPESKPGNEDPVEEPIIEELTVDLGESDEDNPENDHKEQKDENENRQEESKEENPLETEESDQTTREEEPDKEAQKHGLQNEVEAGEEKSSLLRSSKFIIVSGIILIALTTAAYFLFFKPALKSSKSSGIQSQKKAEKNNQNKVVFVTQSQDMVFYFPQAPKPLLTLITIKVEFPAGAKKSKQYLLFRDYLYRHIINLTFYKERKSKWELILVKQIYKLASRWRGKIPIHLLEVSDIEFSNTKSL